MSPSIHPLPSVPRPNGSTALPTGLGAGGRGKEKAPCRYLHFEVDLDEEDDLPVGSEVKVRMTKKISSGGNEEGRKMKRTHRIELGLGPIGKGYTVVCNLIAWLILNSL